MVKRPTSGGCLQSSSNASAHRLPPRRLWRSLHLRAAELLVVAAAALVVAAVAALVVVAVTIGAAAATRVARSAEHEAAHATTIRMVTARLEDRKGKDRRATANQVRRFSRMPSRQPAARRHHRHRRPPRSAIRSIGPVVARRVARTRHQAALRSRLRSSSLERL